MRTIKFRFWRDGKMQQAHQLNAYVNTNNNFAGDGEILMQFTGLTDKNGVEIYESDILKVGAKHGFNSELLNEFKEKNNLLSINGIGIHFVGIVRIDLLRGLMFENPKNGYQEPMFTRHRDIKANHSDFEVIGNIHENPELLKYKL